MQISIHHNKSTKNVHIQQTKKASNFFDTFIEVSFYSLSVSHSLTQFQLSVAVCDLVAFVHFFLGPNSHHSIASSNTSKQRMWYGSVFRLPVHSFAESYSLRNDFVCVCVSWFLFPIRDGNGAKYAGETKREKRKKTGCVYGGEWGEMTENFKILIKFIWSDCSSRESESQSMRECVCGWMWQYQFRKYFPHCRRPITSW